MAKKAKKEQKGMVCVTYMYPGGREKMVCKKMTRREANKLIKWPKTIKGVVEVHHF